MALVQERKTLPSFVTLAQLRKRKMSRALSCDLLGALFLQDSEARCWISLLSVAEAEPVFVVDAGPESAE